MAYEIVCTLGKFDIPVLQDQPDFLVDLLQSNIMLLGAPQSGKTNLLRLIINILHKKCCEETEQIFLLDFGGALAAYKDMPLVAAYFDSSNEEYVKRIFKILERKLQKNIEALSGIGYAAMEGERPIHTTFIIDNFNAFMEEPRYAGYLEKFSRLARDGISKGITIVISASDTKGLFPYMKYFAQRIAVNVRDDVYSEFFGRKVTGIGNIVGRGYANVTYSKHIPPERRAKLDLSCPYELHLNTAEPITGEAFLAALDTKFERLEIPPRTGSPFRYHVKRYESFPKDFDEAQYKRFLPDGTDGTEQNSYQVAVGLDYTEFHPVICDFLQSRCLAIYAKRDFGAPQLLRRLVEQLMKKSKRKLVLFDDGRNQLADLKKQFENETELYISRFAEKDVRRAVEQTAAGAFGQRLTPTMASKVGGKLPEPSGGTISKKLSPMQQMIQYIHEHCLDLGNFADRLYLSQPLVKTDVRDGRIPRGCEDVEKDPTVFVMHSKMLYSSAAENKVFLQFIMPMLADLAEQRDYIFIFSDVQRMADSEMNVQFKGIVRTAFVLDSIADFVAERGQKTVFSDMDVKMLRSDYAKSERGDAFFYDVEADDLRKLRLIDQPAHKTESEA